MSDSTPYAPGTPLAIHTEHGYLHGQLALPADPAGLVVLVQTGSHPAAHDAALAAVLRQSGLATFAIDLLAQQEEHFPDAQTNVPLLTKRLLECLGLIKRQMLNEEIPALRIGLCAGGHGSPVVVRAAALRDHDIAAVVCRGGLIDLAGMLYLRSLESPLLLLVGEADAHLIGNSHRALQEVACGKALEIIPASDSEFASTEAFEAMAQRTASWFATHF
jgi:dienelactone hydrolase